MDLWMIGNKLILLFYVIVMTYFVDVDTPELILVTLIYIVINVAIPIFRRARSKPFLSVGSAVFVLVIAHTIHPLFLLLLPINLFELEMLFARSAGYPLLALILGVVPMLLLQPTHMPIYILTTVLSYMLLYGILRCQQKLALLEESQEQFRQDVHRLTRTLNENIEYIRQSEYTFKLEERNHLSQRIHDEVGHAMAGALIQMEAARMLLERDRDKASELLGNAISISKEGLERIRLTLKEMKPKPEELGIHRLRLFADEISAQHGITATLTHSGEMDVLQPIHWKIIQENAKEAVTNTLKYGHATTLALDVRVFHQMIRFVIADNGKGAEKIVKGLGIVGMEERTASVGGTVLVDGAQGFRITTLLPIHE